MFVRISKPANLLLPGFRHYRATPLIGQLQYRTTAGSTKWGRMRLLRGPAHPFKDLDTAKGFLRGSHSWGEAGFEPGTSALRRPDATIALPGHPLRNPLLHVLAVKIKIKVVIQGLSPKKVGLFRFGCTGMYLPNSTVHPAHYHEMLLLLP